MADLLIEIGCEELPAEAIVPLAAHLGRALHAALAEAGLAGGEPVTFATPRRIAARWPDVGARQPDREVERKGPAVRAAYDEHGAPTKALAGFLRSAGASVEELSTIETPKGEWVVLRRGEPGRTLAEALAEALPAVVATMPMPRRMRWGDGEAEFLRPVAWLLALHGAETVPLELFGLVAGNETRGHRFHAPGAIAIADPADYETALERAYVVADFAARRERVLGGARGAVERIEPAREGIGTAASGTPRPPLRPRLDDALVDEVTALVEWPVALVGGFDNAFLELPEEALIQTMEENQRYFAVRDADGTLTDAFVTVANLESTRPATVVAGNERVIRPRFADTMFFWEQDRTRTLASMRPALDRVLFQQKLGSVGDKVTRLGSVVKALAPRIGADPDETQLAASLCKCDLVSAIVEELPKMQGVAGRYYAARDGHPDVVAAAMEEHYFPKRAGGVLPTSPVAQTLALADKADTLVGIYGQGLVPSGGKDPFGLRRASLGIVRILLEGGVAKKGHDLDIAEIVSLSAASYGGRLGEINEAAIVDYVIERLRVHLVEDAGRNIVAVGAVLAKRLSNPLDIVARLDAIEEFRQTDAVVALAAASKRVSNILKKAETSIPETVITDTFVEPAERALYDALETVRPDIENRLAVRDYAGAMAATSTLREPVDKFFDEVMVMAEDTRLRDNRLALLGQFETLSVATVELSHLDPPRLPLSVKVSATGVFR